MLQQVEQDDDALLTAHALVDAFQLGEWAFDNAYPMAGLQIRLFITSLALLQLFDQAGRQRVRLAIERHDAAKPRVERSGDQLLSPASWMNR